MDSVEPRADAKLESDSIINYWDYLLQIAKSRDIITEEQLRNIIKKEDLKMEPEEEDFLGLRTFEFEKSPLEDTFNCNSKYQFEDLKWPKPMPVEQDQQSTCSIDSFSDDSDDSMATFIENLNKSAEYKAKENAEVINNDDWWLDIHDYDIKKQIIQRGMETIKKPKNGDICVVNIIGSLENGKIVDSYFNHKIFVGDRQISQGIDLVLETMYMDECARIKIGPKHNFDKRGKRYDLPNDAYVFYMIRLLGIERDFTKKLERHTPKKPKRSSDKTFQMNNSIMRKQFFDMHFMLPLEEICLEKKWYDEINLQQLAIDPVNTYTKIVIAEIIMNDYDEAIQTANHILTHIDLSNVTVAYLRDALMFTIGCYEESKVILGKYVIQDIQSRVSLVPDGTYAKIQDIKKTAMELEKNKKQKVKLGDKIIWILAIGASVVSFGSLINIVF